MKAFKFVLNAIIIILALQSLFTLISVTLAGITNTGGSLGAVGRITGRELMYPLFFIAGIAYYKKANEKPMITVSTIGLLSKILFYIFSWSRFSG